MDKPHTPRMPLPIRSGGSDNIIPSSSPAFGTPARPVRAVSKPINKPSVLPVLLPPALLRPLAFRTFTRKHDLTISSNTLQTLATFVGKNCGSRWREDGLAERLLDEVAKLWRKNGGGVIVEEGNGASIKAILAMVESNMSNGKVVPGKLADQDDLRGSHAGLANNDETNNGTGGDEDDENASGDPRRWMKVIDAFDQPRLTYNPNKKHFETTISNPSLFPNPSHQIAFWRDKYNLVYQRLLRNESFQTSSLLNNNRQSYKITPIANLLGRSGSSHMCLGLLSVSPAGELSLTDMTGSIMLELSNAVPIPNNNGAWFAPGMIVLVEGVYEEEDVVKGSVLGGNSGIGGAIGGKFLGISIAGPPCEKREVTLGMNSVNSNGDIGTSGGFGWVDFLGVGSERAQGARMRKLENKNRRQVVDGIDSQGSGRRSIVILSEVHLDNTRTFEALRSVFETYSTLPFEELPLAFLMIGNFIEKVGFGQGSGGNSIEYKECFDSLASVLSDFPALLNHTTFIFVPGDNDPWASTFTAGASSAIPRKAVPDLFTSRVKRAFTSANNDSGASKSTPGEAIWTSNPSRISLYGPVHEIVVYRDDISGRLRRSSVHFSESGETQTMSTTAESGGKDADDDNMILDDDTTTTAAKAATPSASILSARKLVKTILDQGTLAPFPITSKPVLWDYASSIQLYPLPTALILADSEVAAFATTYEGCHVMNPGKFLPDDKRDPVTWLEYDVLKKRARVKQKRV